MAEIPQRAVILVVEDEPFIRMVAVDLLAEEGRVILEAGSAQEALEVIAAEGRIDLLFTDINMPGELDGLDLAGIAYSRQPDLKVVVTSGATQLADGDIPDHGVFMSKPYSAGNLARVVKAKLAAAS
ncbi:response regulator [Sphingomonas endolithica]|uniref:response regulator n=1 Tax=Sphingomonas endolithica TaxID=2972485 RepID=UPI0021B0448F|nr:response regulator [Sphingomonas sp. ZFBP2030]